MKTYQKVILITVIVILACAAIAVLLFELAFWVYIIKALPTAMNPVESPDGNWECTEPYYIYMEIGEGCSGYVIKDGIREEMNFCITHNTNLCAIEVVRNNCVEYCLIVGEFEQKDDLLIVHDDDTKQDFVFHRVE